MANGLSIIDVAQEIGVNEKTVRRWIKSGELHATKDVIGRYRITRADLDNFIQRRTEKYNQGLNIDNEEED